MTDTYFSKFKDKFDEYSEAVAICHILQDEGYQAVLAGGCVRDILSNKPFNDIDIATNAHPGDVSKLLENTYKVKEVGKAFGVVLVEKNGYEYEIATFRLDNNCDGRKPNSVTFSSMKEDALRRDFTINAVFYDPISYNIYDFVDGVKDIREKNLRFVGNASSRIREDYLRILRYIRFASKGYAILDSEKEIVEALSAFMGSNVAPERIILELKKMVKEENFILYSKIFPITYKLLFPTNVLDFSSRVLNTFESVVALFFYDNEDLFDGWSRHYKLSKTEDYNIKGILRYKDFFYNENVDLSELRILVHEPFFNDLINLIEYKADSFEYEQYEEFKEAIEVYKNTPLPEKLITGDILIEQGFKPSEYMGKLLKKLYEAQLNNEFDTVEKGLDIVYKIAYNDFILELMDIL